MKTIADEISLEGKLETITATEFRSRPGEVLDSVALGKCFVVTKQGNPIAVISKPPGETLTIEFTPDGTKTFRL